MMAAVLMLARSCWPWSIWFERYPPEPRRSVLRFPRWRYWRSTSRWLYLSGSVAIGNRREVVDHVEFPVIWDVETGRAPIYLSRVQRIGSLNAGPTLQSRTFSCPCVSSYTWLCT